VTDQTLAERAGAVLQEWGGKLSHLEFRVNYKNADVEEPFALVRIAFPRTGYGPPEERLLSGYDTAEAMYRHVISDYGQPPPLIKTLRVTPLPAEIYVDEATNSVRAEMNILFTPASVRAARHRAEEEADALERNSKGRSQLKTIPPQPRG
jgi:hypothetical protein